MCIQNPQQKDKIQEEKTKEIQREITRHIQSGTLIKSHEYLLNNQTAHKLKSNQIHIEYKKVESSINPRDTQRNGDRHLRSIIIINSTL